MPVPLGGPRPRAILAYIALHAPRAVGRTEIIEAIWGFDPPRSVVNALQTHVSMLRKALGPDIVETVGDGYRLGAHVDVDVAEFDRAMRAGATMLAHGEAIGASELLRAALALWRGPALADLGGAAFADPEAARLEELRLDARERRVEADLDAGRNDELVAELEALVAAHPLRETLCGQLMRALYRSGRQADALSIFEATRRRLADELGLEPSPALRELHFRLLNQTDRGPTTPTRERTWARVPALPNETFGREADLSALEALVTAPHGRLVCITGPGGVGKTRLATELGHRLLGRYRDGVSFVGLADAQTPADVAPTICAALGVGARGEDPVATLESGLRGQQMVLICDNFEHVAGAATLISRILAAAPGLRVVVTSRRLLNLRGECQYVLEPLQYTVDGEGLAAAVSLFTARARAVVPDLAPGPADLADVADICARCDGLPLAIELAAARMQVLTVAELRERLDRPLPVLIGGPRDAPARHQTLRTSIASSVAAMATADQAFLAALSVFRGGFTLTSAAAVNQIDDATALRRLETLLDHSLVRGRASAPGHRRFDLLVTVREFLDESLDPQDRQVLRRRQAEYLRTLMGPVPDPGVRPYRYQEWQIQLAERPNIRAAIRWADEEGEAELFADLVISAGATWVRLGPRDEIDRWLREICSNEAVSPGRRADAFTRRAWLTEITGNLADTQRLMAEAQALVDGSANNHRTTMVSLYDSWYRLHAGDEPGAAKALARARASCLAAGEPPELQCPIHIVAMLAASAAGDQAAADRHAMETVRLARQHGLDTFLPTALNNLCEIWTLGGRPDDVIAWAEEAMTVNHNEAFDVYAWLLSQRGIALLEKGDVGGAERDFTASLLLYLREGLAADGIELVQRLAATTAHGGWLGLAATLSAAFDTVAAGTVVAGSPTVRKVRKVYLADLPTRLGAEYQRAAERGRDLVRDLDYREVFRAVLDLLTKG